MKLITICYYEYPAALHEIDAWEKLKNNQIITKTKLLDNVIYYKLENELLICIPVGELINSFNYETFLKNGKYYKTLIFGKVDSNNLKNILEKVIVFENINV